jgi:hypothetical protein
LRLASPAVVREILRAFTSTSYGGTEATSLDALDAAEAHRN